MGSFVVRSKSFAVVGVTLLLVSACTSSGDAAELGPVTTSASRAEAAPPAQAADTVDTPATPATTATGIGTGDEDSDANSDETPSASGNEGLESDNSAGGAVARTDVEPDGFDDGTVLTDTDGVFDNASISAVILECASGEPAACGNLGRRLARSESMSESERSAAICTAGPLLGEEGQSRLAGIVTLSLLFADAEPSISGPIETIRLTAPGDPQLDSAIAAAVANASLSC